MKRSCFKSRFWKKEGFTQKGRDVVICPPCGESVAGATKEGQNRKKALWPLLPRLTAVLPPQGREMSNAFTLIELLVVVLIIGILTAVAVPQYQKAVARARAAEAITVLKAITDAQEVYYLAHGEYTDNLEDLDVSAPADGTYFTYSCKQQRTCQASPKLDGYPVFEFNMMHPPYGYVSLNAAGKHFCFVARLINQGASADVVAKARGICSSFGELDPDIDGGTHYLITR